MKSEKERQVVPILLSITVVLAAGIIGFQLFFFQEPQPVVFLPQASQTESEAPKKWNINTATEEELDENLPGIGPVIAKRIVEYRETYGAFATIEEIQEVSGIGEKLFDRIKGSITVDG